MILIDFQENDHLPFWQVLSQLSDPLSRGVTIMLPSIHIDYFNIINFVVSFHSVQQWVVVRDLQKCSKSFGTFLLRSRAGGRNAWLSAPFDPVRCSIPSRVTLVCTPWCSRHSSSFLESSPAAPQP